mgnify:CR=1 FL=1
MIGHLFLIDRSFLSFWLVIGSQFCAQFPQPRLTRASSGRSNPIVRSPLECGCPRWREREMGLRSGGEVIPFFLWFVWFRCSYFYSACIFFYCYFPMPNLYLVSFSRWFYSFFLQFDLSCLLTGGILQDFVLFYICLSGLFRLLLVKRFLASFLFSFTRYRRYFWFWLARH